MEKELDFNNKQAKSKSGQGLDEGVMGTKHFRFKKKASGKVPNSRFFLKFLLTLFVLVGFVVFNLSKSVDLNTAATFAKGFLFPYSAVPNSDNDRLNIIVLGVGGKGHEGSLLTDTILNVSVPTSPGKVVIVSVPRDIWIPEIRAKINSAYYWGSKKETGGLSLSKSTVSKVLGVNPNYGVVVDFSGFKNIVDGLGGIEVNVEKSFTDNFYPIPGKENDKCDGDIQLRCRYETITFTEGRQNMNGELALKYVRSRHSEDDQGTDTARQARQQTILDAVKNRLLSVEVLKSPKRLFAVWSAVKDSVETDMDVGTIAFVSRKLFDSRNSIGNYLIPDEYLVNPPISSLYDRQYVFIPKSGNGNWSQINLWFESLLN